MGLTAETSEAEDILAMVEPVEVAERGTGGAATSSVELDSSAVVPETTVVDRERVDEVEPGEAVEETEVVV